MVIEGPKACGKTATARQQCASEVLLDGDQNARQAVALDPALVLDGPPPRLIDEWQVEPEIWNQVRRTVDDRAAAGQFILTGSAVPADDIVRHTGAGRITRLRMRPMSLFEAGVGTGQVSLGALLAGQLGSCPDPGLHVTDLAREVVVGGWPGFRGLRGDAAVRAPRDYLDEIRRTDVNRVDGRSRDPEKLGRLLRSLGRHTATAASVATLVSDVGRGGEEVHRETVSDYLEALQRLMIVENQPTWAPHLRSRRTVRSTPARHFVDPSLAAAAMGASPETLRDNLQTLGLLFESLVVRDLRVHGQSHGAEVLQYRDNTGLEVDAIVRRSEGPWIACEVKLGAAEQVDQGAATLLRFADQVDLRKAGRPSALVVVTGVGYGYVRDDGVAVVPIGALGP